MAIAEDASTPAVVTGTGVGTLTTAAFSPPAGSLLVAIVAAELYTTTAPTITVSDSAGHSWVSQQDVILSSGGRGGEPAILTAYLPTAPGSITVSAAFDTNLTGGRLLAVRVVTGADQYQYGQALVSVGTASSTSTGLTITPTHTGSWIYGLSVDFTSAATFTAAAGTTLISSHVNTTDGATAAAWRLTATGTAGTAVSPGGTWSTANVSVSIAVEILPAGTYITTGLTGLGATTHYQWLYDSTIGATEPARTNAAIAACEADNTLMQSWFGPFVTPPTGMTVLVKPGTSTGPSASWIGTPTAAVIQLNPGTNAQYNTTSGILRYLLLVEVVEIFMLSQNKGWFNNTTNNEGSNGEGLSLFLGAQFLMANGLTNAGIAQDFARSPLWVNSARNDYVNAAPVGRTTGVESACALLFLHYLWSQLGHSVRDIISSASPTSLRQVYSNLTQDTSDPFPLFVAQINLIYPLTSGNTITPYPDSPYPLSRGIIYEDASTPPVVTGTGVGTLTTASFSPPAGSLLVAKVALGKGAAAGTITVSDSGTHTWTTRASVVGTGTNFGAVQIAYTYLTSAPGSITVSAAFTNITGGQVLDVRVLRGASPTQIGGVGTLNRATATSAVSSVSLTTVIPGSHVQGISNDPAAADGYSSTTIGQGFWDFTNAAQGNRVVSWNEINATSVPGAATLGVTWSSNAATQVAAMEVLPLRMAALPTFTDGVVVNAAGLTTVTAGIDTLAQLTTGRTAASAVSTKPILKLQQTTAQPVPNNATTLIPWSTKVIDTDGMWSTGTVITVKTAGWWDIHLQVPFVSGAANFEAAILFINGTAYPGNVGAEKDEPMVQAGAISMQCHLYERLQVGDTIQAAYFQASGAALNTATTDGGLWLAAIWDAPY